VHRSCSETPQTRTIRKEAHEFYNNEEQQRQYGEHLKEPIDKFSAMDHSEELQDVPMAVPEQPVSSSNAENDAVASDETDATTTTIAGQAESTIQSSVESCEPEVIPELESPELEVGDHVYQWRSLCGVPFMFQHHGIVMDVIRDSEGNPTRLTIADFSNVETKPTKKSKKSSKIKQQQEGDTIQSNDVKQSTTSSDAGGYRDTEIEARDKSLVKEEIESSAADKVTTVASRSPSRRLSLEQEGIMRTYTDTDKWHKVHYQSGWLKRQFRRSGTVTKAKSDPVGLVLARVNFIMQHPDQLPDYHVVHANCECVAFWCKTGHWSTLQASSFLELTAAGQAKQSATLAATAAGATANVTVPAAGIWGSWFGFTTTTSVSWLSLHPMAIPGLACYAAVTIGVPAIMYATANKVWKETSQRLSDTFWESARENPEIFAECITHWSEK